MSIDPVGLTIGALGLASLFGICVECFGYVDGGRSDGRDLEILIAKLEVDF
jgi:hypothetical protein